MNFSSRRGEWRNWRGYIWTIRQMRATGTRRSERLRRRERNTFSHLRRSSSDCHPNLWLELQNLRFVYLLQNCWSNRLQPGPSLAMPRIPRKSETEARKREEEKKRAEEVIELLFVTKMHFMKVEKNIFDYFQSIIESVNKILRDDQRFTISTISTCFF